LETLIMETIVLLIAGVWAALFIFGALMDITRW
jgi:hypothetical protein